MYSWNFLGGTWLLMIVERVSVSTLVDGVVGALFDGSRSRSGARLGLTGMGIGYQRVIA